MFGIETEDKMLVSRRVWARDFNISVNKSVSK